MNRWKGDDRKQVSPIETSESVGAKADSADSSFGSTLPKKPKSDFKLMNNQPPKTQFKVEKFPQSNLKQSISLNDEEEMPINVHQEMYKIRKTIIEQEATFREQVRELHRVYNVQTLLMAEMKKRDPGLLSHSSVTNLVGPSHSPSEFPSMNSGNKIMSWKSSSGHVLDNSCQDYESSISLPEPMKGGSTITPHETQNATPQESKLFKRTGSGPPVRRTFDLERPPEDDDDDDEEEEELQKEVEGAKHVLANSLNFTESPASCDNEPENDVSLNLSSGWARGTAGKGCRDYSDKGEHEFLRASKRTREGEEAALFPFLAPKSERDVPLRPLPIVAGQSSFGGAWDLQLGRKPDSLPKADNNNTSDETEFPKKKERQLLNLEANEKVVPATLSQGAPHWLFQAPPKPSKKTACNTESSSPSLQDSFSTLQQGVMKSFPHSGRDAGSGPAQGSVWAGERQVSGTPPRNQSQSSHIARRVGEEDGGPGIEGVYKPPVPMVGSTVSAGAGYAPFKLAQGSGEGPPEALTLYSPWRDGEGPSNNYSHNVFTQGHHPLATGFGVQLRTFEGHPGLAQGLVQVGPINIGSGTTTFVPDSGAGVWYQQRNSFAQFQHQQFQSHHHIASLQAGPLSSSQGTLYAIPAATGPAIGFPIDSLRKIGEDISGANWTSGSGGPPFSPFSIVAPPKPPFKKPPKLVLTHDGTTMELKLVSPEKGAAAKLVTVDKSYSGSSDEEVGEKREKRPVLNQSQVQKEKDVSMRPRAKREREEKTTTTGSLKENGSPSSGGARDWMVEKVSTGSVRSRVQGGRNGVQPGTATAVVIAQQEGMDEADGRSSNAGSGVGDVINADDRASPSMGSFAARGSNCNLLNKEEEEGVTVGELGIQPDSEAQSKKFERKSTDDKPHKHQEAMQEQFSSSLSFRGGLSTTIARKTFRENLDGSQHGIDHPQKRLRSVTGGTEELEQRVHRVPVFQRVVEQSASSGSGSIKNLLDKGNQAHGVSLAQPNSDELRNTQLGLQQPTGSTSEPRIHSLTFLDSGSQGKERLNLEESSERPLSSHGSKHLREPYGGRTIIHSDGIGRGKTEDRQRKTGFSQFGDVCKQERETKQGHSKQLSGASTSEKDLVHHNARSPGLHQVPSPSSREDLERQAEGSLKKVSQASETVQGNGRSPLRTGEWIEPLTMEQDHFCSPGGIDYSCEEVDGTLVKSLQGSETEQKGKDVSPGGTYSASLSHKDLGRPDAAMDMTDPSSLGMCISKSTIKVGATSDSPPVIGMLKGERQSANSRRMTGLSSPVVDEGKSHNACLKHSNRPKAQITGKPEGSMDGDKDSVSSSKPTQETDRSGGSDCITGEVLNDFRETKCQESRGASTIGYHLEMDTPALNSSSPSLQSRSSGPTANRPHVSPIAVQENMDELSENPCENSNLAASVLLSLAPKGPSSSSTRSKAEKKRSLSILQRSTDKLNDAVHMKMEQQVAPSKISGPNSSSLTSELDVGSSASVKLKVATPVPVLRESGFWRMPPKGETENSSTEPHLSPTLDWFETVTLQLTETVHPKDPPISGWDAANQKCKDEHKISETRGVKPTKKRKTILSKNSQLGSVHANSTSSPKSSIECRQTRVRMPCCGSESGIQLTNSRSSVGTATGRQYLGRVVLKACSPVKESKEVTSCLPLQQGSSDPEEGSSKGGESSRADSAEANHPRSVWGDVSRGKRMRQPRKPKPAGQQIVSPVGKGGR